MRIGLDARWIFGEISGIGAYTRELIRHLALLDHDNHYVIFFNSAALKDRLLEETGLERSDNFSACVLPFGLFSIANQLQLPRILMEQRLDVYHSPNYLIPLRAFPRNRPGRVRCVTNLHDLIPLIFPEYTPRSRKRRIFPLYRWLMLQVGMRSDIILTGSSSARNDIIRHLRIPPERMPAVLAIPDGVAARFKPAAPGARARSGTPADELGPGGQRGAKVILWVGRPDPYKNLAGLIAAFARLKHEAHFPAILRLAGSRDARYPEAGRLAAQLGVERDVVQTGYLTDDQLVREYQGADVFVLPSFYEGFGLPVLEAMACGTPVVCSRQGSLPEVAGDAALQVRPQDVPGLAEAIRRVLSEPALAADLAARGLRQAARFTWAATAQETLRAYWRALA